MSVKEKAVKPRPLGWREILSSNFYDFRNCLETGIGLLRQNLSQTQANWNVFLHQDHIVLINSPSTVHRGYKQLQDRRVFFHYQYWQSSQNDVEEYEHHAHEQE